MVIERGRLRCRGDRHRPDCQHLRPPRPRGRPRINRRSEAQEVRRLSEKMAFYRSDMLGDSDGQIEGINEHEKTPLIGGSAVPLPKRWRALFFIPKDAGRLTVCALCRVFVRDLRDHAQQHVDLSVGKSWPPFRATHYRGAEDGPAVMVWLGQVLV